MGRIDWVFIQDRDFSWVESPQAGCSLFAQSALRLAADEAIFRGSVREKPAAKCNLYL